MSAIAGLIDWGGGPAGQAVRSALHALEWHGRDGQGLWEDGSAALGWRQTILHEEDYNDKQPLLGTSGIRLVVDGPEAWPVVLRFLHRTIGVPAP